MRLLSKLKESDCTVNYGQDKEPKPDKDGYYAAHSADGVNFIDEEHNPVLPTGGNGNANDPSGPEQWGDVGQFEWDFHRSQYFATIKTFYVVNTSTGWTMPRRSVSVARSRDYRS